MPDEESATTASDEQDFAEFDEVEASFEAEDTDESQEEAVDTEDESSADESEESVDEEAVEETEEPEESQDESESEEESAEEDTASESPEEAQKRYNDEMAKRRIAEKRLREEREQREQERLDDYLKAAEDDEIEYAKRQLEVQQHLILKEQMALTQEKLQVGIDKSLASIDMFRTGTPEMKQELASSLDDFERMYVEKDKDGNIIKVNADVYQFLQDKASSIARIAGIGARQQTKQKAQEKARTVTKPSKAPKQPKADPDLDGFDEEANRW